ncbi:NEW3 domain-containing protein [Dehalococcoidia bacterium]|nr:NEW3 domain-containing protein [Dehalococcoidia bacterium]
MSKFARVGVSLVLALMLLSGIAGHHVAVAEEPERGISLYAVFPDVVVPLGEEEIELSLTVANTGEVVENLRLLVISAPDGWDYQFEAGRPKRIVRAVTLPPRDADESRQSLTFTVTPPGNVKVGDYRFALKAVTQDGFLEAELQLTIGLSGEPILPGFEVVELTTDFPALEGTPGDRFEFTVTIANKGGEDLVFDLAAMIPRGWGVFFSPGWRPERIRSLPVEAGRSEDVKITLLTPPHVEAGEYPIMFQASSGDIVGTIDLKAIITGTYELLVDTIVGGVPGLLNIRATAGQPTHITLVLRNAGTAALDDFSFTSRKPEGWTITFDPDELASLDAGQVREIGVIIEPPGRAIAGDYMVNLRISSDQADESLDFRVTVETPTIWGWVGMAIVIVVLAALLGIFATLKRR